MVLVLLISELSLATIDLMLALKHEAIQNVALNAAELASLSATARLVALVSLLVDLVVVLGTKRITREAALAVDRLAASALNWLKSDSVTQNAHEVVEHVVHFNLFRHEGLLTHVNEGSLSVVNWGAHHVDRLCLSVKAQMKLCLTFCLI